MIRLLSRQLRRSLGPSLLVPMLLGAAALAEPRSDKLDRKSSATRGTDYEEVARREHAIEKFIESSKADLDRLKSRVLLRGRAYYRMVRGMPSGDFLVHASLVERQRMALLRDLDALEKLEKDRASAERRRNETRTLRRELEQNEQARGVLLAQRERDRAFELAFSSSRTGASHTAVYGALSPLGFAADSLAALKGELAFPIPGRAEVQVVKKPFASGAGLELRASPGTPVRSIFAGRVAFADHYADYGNTVIIDHGDNYFTVTASLSAVDVKVGQELSAGTRVGVVGIEGGSGIVYFEVRRGPETLEPGEWFGI
jgi:murein hydrolase activator